MTRIYIILLLVLCLLNSCIDEIALPIRTEKPKLVVEGLITNDRPPYRVRMTYSGDFQYSENIPEDLYVQDATVTISDDIGNSTPLIYTGAGFYQTIDNSFVGQIGRSYTLTVNTPEATYMSKPERLLSVPAIDTIYAEFDDMAGRTPRTGYRIYVDTKDPDETQNFYRWETFAYSRRRATGILCVTGSSAPCYENCWVPIYSNNLIIASDAAINGNTLKKQFVFFSPVYNVAGQHLIEVSQYSLTREAYQFWRRYQEQTTRVGSIFDPLPAPIEGNVTNSENPDDIALGYFAASTVVKKRYIVSGAELLRFPYSSILLTADVPNGDCRQVFPSGQLDMPEGW